MTNIYENELETALLAVSEASLMCEAIGAEMAPQALEKGDRSPVTIADFGSQALICRALYEAFPGVSIIAEEESGELMKPENSVLLNQLVDHVNRIRPYTDADEVLSWIEWGTKEQDPTYFWTLDPIDGTKGFVRGDQYAISVCLVEGGELRVAGLACPRLRIGDRTRGVVLGAVAGAGAFRLPIDLRGERTPIRVSDVDQPASIRFLESVETGHASHELSAVVAAYLGVQSPPVRMDSQAKYASVALGLQEAYLNLQPCFQHIENIWDHAGGALVVTEAGGCVTDIRGKPFDFSQGRTLAGNCGAVATNGRVHSAILDALRAQRSCCRSE